MSLYLKAPGSNFGRKLTAAVLRCYATQCFASHTATNASGTNTTTRSGARHRKCHMWCESTLTRRSYKVSAKAVVVLPARRYDSVDALYRTMTLPMTLSDPKPPKFLRFSLPFVLKSTIHGRRDVPFSAYSNKSDVSGDFPVQLATRLPDRSAGDLLRCSAVRLSVCLCRSPKFTSSTRTTYCRHRLLARILYEENCMLPWNLSLSGLNQGSHGRHIPTIPEEGVLTSRDPVIFYGPAVVLMYIYFSKVANFYTHPTCICRPHRVIPFECRRYLWCQKTSPGAIVWHFCVILCLAVLIQYLSVTDRHTTTSYTALRIASHGKNVKSHVF